MLALAIQSLAFVYQFHSCRHICDSSLALVDQFTHAATCKSSLACCFSIPSSLLLCDLLAAKAKAVQKVVSTFQGIRILDNGILMAQSVDESWPSQDVTLPRRKCVSNPVQPAWQTSFDRVQVHLLIELWIGQFYFGWLVLQVLHRSGQTCPPRTDERLYRAGSHSVHRLDQRPNFLPLSRTPHLQRSRSLNSRPDLPIQPSDS